GAGDLAFPQPADEDAALPGGKAVSRVEGHARDGDGRHPEDDRLLRAVTRGIFRDSWTEIIAAVAHHRPAVVPARLDNVDLVPPARSLLGRPELPGLRVDAQRVPIAVAERVDGWLEFGSSDEWIVWRHSSIVSQPDHLTRVIAGVLRTNHLGAGAGGGGGAG